MVRQVSTDGDSSQARHARHSALNREISDQTAWYELRAAAAGKVIEPLKNRVMHYIGGLRARVDG